MADNVKELINYPETIQIEVQSISKGVRDVYADEQVIDTVIKFEAFVDSYQFVQTEELTEAGIAVHPYGAVIVPDTANAENATLKLNYIGKEYSITNVSFNDLETGDTFEVSQEGEEMPARSGGSVPTYYIKYDVDPNNGNPSLDSERKVYDKNFNIVSSKTLEDVFEDFFNDECILKVFRVTTGDFNDIYNVSDTISKAIFKISDTEDPNYGAVNVKVIYTTAYASASTNVVITDTTSQNKVTLVNNVSLARELDTDAQSFSDVSINAEPLGEFNTTMYGIAAFQAGTI